MAVRELGWIIHLSKVSVDARGWIVVIISLARGDRDAYHNNVIGTVVLPLITLCSSLYPWMGRGVRTHSTVLIYVSSERTNDKSHRTPDSRLPARGGLTEVSEMASELRVIIMDDRSSMDQHMRRLGATEG